MGTNQTVGKGLYYLALAQILGLLAVIPLVGPFVALAGEVIQILGIYVLSRRDIGYRMAFVGTILALVMDLLTLFVEEETGLYSLLRMVSAVANFLVVYNICTNTSRILRGIDPVLAEKALRIIRIYTVGTVVIVLSMMVVWIPVLNVLAAVAMVIAAIAMLVSGIMYMIFLWNSQKVLQAAGI